MKKKAWILCVIAVVVVIAGVSICLYQQPLSAGSLFPDGCRYVTYYYKAYPTAEAGEAVPLPDAEMAEILNKYEVKRIAADKEIPSGVSYYLIELTDEDDEGRWPLLYIFSDGRVWADTDSGQGIASYEVTGEHKEALFTELAARLQTDTDQ